MNLKPLLIILISLLFFASSASSAILFYEDFEDEIDTVLDPDRDWVAETSGTGSMELSSEQARAGSKSYKFSATGTVYGTLVRQEIQLRNLWNTGASPAEWYFSQRVEYWVGFSIFLATGYESPNYSTGSICHHQYHTTQDGPPTCDPIEDGHHGLMIKTVDSNWYNWIHYDANQCTDGTIQGVYNTYDAYEIGEWVDFVVHVFFDYDNDGYLQIWKDGILIEDYSGPTWPNDNYGPFFKHGIYATIDVHQIVTVYIDEYRLGDADSSYSEVAPTSSPAPSAPTVTVSQPTDVTSISATGQGTLVNVGSDNATKRGFCWNSTGSPTIADSHTEETGNFGESDIGAFTGSITGLNPSQHYYLKSYAYNTAGYGYSDAVEFYAQSSTSEISKAGWSLKYADSEEVTGEDGNATNAFDDNESTIWHTEWYESDPVCPHEIQINLGASYDLTGFRYMPRQDDGDNGRINGYEFYTSTDGTNWGSAVADGNFTDTAYEQEDLFTTVTGQYVKLIATSSHDNDAWTTVAEIDVLGGTVDSGTNMPSRTYGIGLSGCSLR